MTGHVDALLADLELLFGADVHVMDHIDADGIYHATRWIEPEDGTDD